MCLTASVLEEQLIHSSLWTALLVWQTCFLCCCQETFYNATRRANKSLRICSYFYQGVVPAPIPEPVLLLSIVASISAWQDPQLLLMNMDIRMAERSRHSRAFAKPLTCHLLMKVWAQDGRSLNFPADYDAMTIASLEAEGFQAVIKRLRTQAQAELVAAHRVKQGRWAELHGCNGISVGKSEMSKARISIKSQMLHLGYWQTDQQAVETFNRMAVCIGVRSCAHQACGP